jgi:hypothetical protein
MCLLKSWLHKKADKATIMRVEKTKRFVTLKAGFDGLSVSRQHNHKTQSISLTIAGILNTEHKSHDHTAQHQRHRIVHVSPYV